MLIAPPVALLLYVFGSYVLRLLDINVGDLDVLNLSEGAENVVADDLSLFLVGFFANRVLSWHVFQTELQRDQGADRWAIIDETFKIVSRHD